MTEFIDRPRYMDMLWGYKDKDIVKILTGLRRSGKSTLLEMFRNRLLADGIPQSHIIHMNMESLKYEAIIDYKTLYDFVSPKLSSAEKHYLLFDELQNVSHWEKAIESFRLDADVDIYITGSNSRLLSGEFSTLLSGRYVEIRVLPLSFKEFLSFNTFPADMSIDEKFQRYVMIGGMPILSQMGFDDERIMQTLEGIYSTVVMKDVLERAGSTDQSLLQKLVRFLCDNIGSFTSARRISNVLSSDGTLDRGRSGANIATMTVTRYLTLLEDSFFVQPVSRFDIKGTQLLRTQEKIYIIDIGFRNMLLGYKDVDRGHILENLVYLELLRRGWRITVGKVDNQEVDFVTETPHNRMYVQVTESLLGEGVLERELKSLRMIDDNYRKIILTMDRPFVTSYNGIEVINIIDFLLDDGK